MAIEKGNSESMCNYGLMLYTGNGVPMDKKEGLKYFKMAADKVLIKVMYNYEFALNKGDGPKTDIEDSSV